MYAVPPPGSCGGITMALTRASISLAHRVGKDVITTFDDLARATNVPPGVRGVAQENREHLIGGRIDPRGRSATAYGASPLVPHHRASRSSELVPREILQRAHDRFEQHRALVVLRVATIPLREQSCYGVQRGVAAS